MGGKATVLWCRYSHQRDHWGRAVDGGWVFGMGDGRGWLQDTLRFAHTETHRHLLYRPSDRLKWPQAFSCLQMHTRIHTLAWKIPIKWKGQRASLQTRGAVPHPPRSMALWPRLPLLFWRTVKAIIHREKTRETLDSFTQLVTDFHNSPSPPPMQFIHSYPDWVE